MDADIRLLRTRPFDRWAGAERIDDDDLRATADELMRGLMGARLGAGLFKKRIALSGRGKRGGGRTIVAYREGDRIIFLAGFAKNDRTDLAPAELKALRILGKRLLSLDSRELNDAIAAGFLMEIGLP